MECGADGCQTDGLENRECFPISVSSDDTVYGSHKRCLKFVRSLPVPNENCDPGFTRRLLVFFLIAYFIYVTRALGCHTRTYIPAAELLQQ